MPNTLVTFEDFKEENGAYFWWASDLMYIMGYNDLKSFQKVVDKATKVLISLSISHQQEIKYIDRTVEKKTVPDIKLTRFACYLCSMNGDTKKPQTAKFQAYFANQTRKFELHVQKNQELDRINTREEIADGNKSLFSVANQYGLNKNDKYAYSKFTDAGYLGLYNMKSGQLKEKRGLKGNKLFDTMSRIELAANLFRVTLTEERIRNQNIKGQKKLEYTHKNVGQEIRDVVIKNTGKNPENLPQGKGLPKVRSTLKKIHKATKKIDTKNINT